MSKKKTQQRKERERRERKYYVQRTADRRAKQVRTLGRPKASNLHVLGSAQNIALAV